ncbi:ABC transporter, permease protein [Aeromicrobium marinum DSM 15272]|uniref:ABC transporter, permease protein n=1 Tax=Aeromicrobium marinum DSM 15272 TaxID=585531 RepID=E2SBH1_9ACTN|nr:ABC transporter permease subunit [Aeromicrobium marinum]EFQ83717.1 ABC transporter, permease protein [Aeromicrobium marinum DSM 15272]
MTPTVRSRLLAAGVAFLAGFGLANYAIFRVPPPDQWLWVGFAAVLIATSAWAVVISDSPRPVSVWAVIGLEFFTLLTLVPLLWVVTLAVTPGDAVPTALVPEGWDLSAFSDLRQSADLRGAALTSVLAAALATAVAIPVGLAAAVGLFRSGSRAARWSRVAVAGLLMAPLVVLAVAAEDLAVRAELVDRVWVVGVAQSVITVPLATWMFVRLLRSSPWNLVEAARADGARRRTVLLRVWLPSAGPSVLVVALTVFVVAAQDLVLGAALTASPGSATLPSALLSLPVAPESVSLAAAAGLVWLVPTALALVVLSRPLTRLLGRSS